MASPLLSITAAPTVAEVKIFEFPKPEMLVAEITSTDTVPQSIQTSFIVTETIADVKCSKSQDAPADAQSVTRQDEVISVIPDKEELKPGSTQINNIKKDEKDQEMSLLLETEFAVSPEKTEKDEG